MLRIGLTGGAGAGKSTVARRLREHGAVVVDADVLAREVVAPGTAGLAAVVEEFGTSVLRADGTLDRSALAELAFSSRTRRRALEAITHPRIASRTRELFAAAPDDAVVVHDVPLLVEKRMGAAYHLVVVVHAPVEDRVRRLVGRGLPEADARARIAAQAADAERREAADVWLDNSGPRDALEGRVDRLWSWRLVPFEQNVRAGRPAPPSDVALVRPDPEWSEQAVRAMERIATATGVEGTRLQHVGPTAVPGLAAPDVLDLQLVVDSLGSADKLDGTLRHAGYAHVPGDWRDDEPGGTAPVRRYASCDPGRPVTVHLRPEGWSSRHQLLLRDWLRADASEREDLAARQEATASREGSVDREAVQEWVRAAGERAEAWAERVGWAPSRW